MVIRPRRRRQRVPSILLAIASVTVGGVTVGAVPASATDHRPAEKVPVYHPSRLAEVSGSDQVIVVTAPSWRATRGTLRAYERDGSGGWREVVPATKAWLGYGGLAPESTRRQSTGTTPAGTFAIPSAFGRRADPGTALPYIRVDRNDSWPYDRDHPATYNVFQDRPVDRAAYGGSIEWLWAMGPQYDYVAVMDYNLPGGRIVRGDDGIRRTTRPANTRAGGGIFLHVSKGEPTAGCISVPRDTMRDVLRWLDPKRSPVIVVGPTSEIGRM